MKLKVIFGLLGLALATWLFTGAACQGGPHPTGVSVDQTEAGYEGCITFAKTKGCTCPNDAGGGSGIVGR